MRVRLNGPFRVCDDQGRDITPKGLKERGLLALLLLSPGQRRTRAWIQDKLWSDRDTAQASGSLRQALTNVRKALGPCRDGLHSDRSAIWINPPIPLAQMLDPAFGELLEDIDITDPEFVDWLRLLRMQEDDRPAAPLAFAAPPALPPDRPTALICSADLSETSRGRFILRALSQQIASGLAQRLRVEVIETGYRDAAVPGGDPAIRIELECLDEAEMLFVLLRVLGQPNRRVVWSGRLCVPDRLSVIWESPEVVRAVNRTIQAVSDSLVNAAALTPAAAIQKAIRRQQELTRTSLDKADALLRQAMDSELRGLALAMRGLLRVDEVIEFKQHDPDRLAEALDFVEQAAQLAPDDSVVLAKVSEVTSFLGDDADKAAFLARRAVALDDREPDALAALGRTLSQQGRYVEAHTTALAARHHAQGAHNSHDWDLMAGVAKIGIGDLAGAAEMMLACHRKMPFGRHALRYLTVLAVLADRHEDATRYAERLRRLEPDFSIGLLRGPYMPLSQPRHEDMMDRLRAKLN